MKDLENIQSTILSTFLEEAVFNGWTSHALKEATIHAGFEPEMAEIAFPLGLEELTDFFIQSIDTEMEAALKKKKLDQMKIRERIATAVMTRLELFEPHKEAIRKLVAYLSVPTHAPHTLNQLFGTVSKMWYAAGDTSTDYNYYTKRLLLAGVYSSTLLYWLTDDSKEYQNTRSFLDRRIQNVMMIQTCKSTFQKAFTNIPFIGKYQTPKAHIDI